MNLLRKLKSLFRRNQLDAEMADEMRHHLEEQTQRNVRAGMSLTDARYAARRSFGNVASIQQRAREQRIGVWWEQVGKDAMFAARSLANSRGFSLTVIGTLSLGIGVATIVFKFVAPALLFYAPFPDAERLQFIHYNQRGPGGDTLIPVQWELQYQAYREQTAAFSEYAAVRHNAFNVVVSGAPVLAYVEQVSPDCFHTLGITPILGRGFLPEDFKESGSDAVILSDQFWRKHCGADPGILGRPIVLDQRARTVVGVLRPSQDWPRYFEGGDIFQPLPPWQPSGTDQLGQQLFIVGRLAPGVSREQATAALERVVLPDLPIEAKRMFATQRVALVPLRDIKFPTVELWVIAGASFVLYLMACLNAVNLMLVRLLGRRRELSIRLALGGSRGRIVRLLALESIGLALAASAMVIVAAHWAFPFVLAWFSSRESVPVPFLDWRSCGCIFLLSLLACLSIVLLPALRLARVEMQPGLKDGGLGESRRLARLRNGLVALQAALAVILLTATGLMLRSFERIRGLDLGLNPVGLVRVQLSFPPDYTQSHDARLQLFERLKDRLLHLPGVKGVSFGEDTMLTGFTIMREQVEMPDGTYQRTSGAYVAPDFHQVAGLTMRQGRWFSGDRNQNEVVISETMAKALYGDRDPLERAFKLKAYPQYVYRVVGVVHDVRESLRGSPGLRFYAPGWWYPPLISTLVLRMERDPAPEFLGSIRQTIYDFDPRLLALGVSSFGEHWEGTVWRERLAYRVLRSLAGIALGLAMVGMFSTVSYTVDCKRREFGVRMALGALPGDLRQLVLKRSVGTVTLGVLVGAGAGLGLSSTMRSLLFQTETYDPTVYLGVAGLLLGVTILACWLPARRAAKVDPVVVLRAE